MKVLNLVGSKSGAQSYLTNQFFDYMPEGIHETFDPVDADVFFVHVSNGHYAPLRMEDFGFQSSIDLSKRKEFKTLLEILNVINEKPTILYFDSFGVSRPIKNAYHEFVRDIDIPVAVVELPPHPNAFTTHFVDERRFYISHRIPRASKSLIILKDQFIREGIPDVLASLLKKNLLEKITVAGTNDLDFSDPILAPIQSFQDQIDTQKKEWSDGVCSLLNSKEFFLSTQATHGVEIMGIEAGFCGVQPIYPDTPYYREMFQGTDVAFFDVENIAESLEAIIAGGYHWNTEKHEKFVGHCSGTKHLPKFWEHVRKVISQ